MSNTDLIARLRGASELSMSDVFTKAADALEQQAREIEALVGMLRRARNLLTHPPIWSSENAASRRKLSEEIHAVMQSREAVTP